MLGTSGLSGSGFAHAVGVAVGDHDVGVVQEPVEQADRGGVFGQEPAPRFEGPVAGDAQGAAFVGGGDEPEQQLSGGVVEGGEPDFVADDRLQRVSEVTHLFSCQAARCSTRRR